MTQPNEKSQTEASEQDVPPPAPRWVKVFAFVVGIILLSVIILHATGHRAGGHGGHSDGRKAVTAPAGSV